MITVAEPIDADALRIRHEFLDAPDRRVTVDDAALLLGVAPRHAHIILETLAAEGFLFRTADGSYVRAVNR